MLFVFALLAGQVLGHATPTPTIKAGQNVQPRVLVRFTQPAQHQLSGVHPIDAHGDEGLAWTYRNRFEELAATGAPIEMQDADLEFKIKAQRRRLNYRALALAHHWVENPKLWLSDYRKQEEISLALRHAASVSKDIELETLGKSVQGRTLLGLTIPGRGALAKKRLLVMGTQHAREWLSTMACMALLSDWMIKHRDSGRDRPTLTVIPVVNPDGYAYSWNQDRLWRKNRGGPQDESGLGGVDLNRNWGQSWGDPHGASPQPHSDAYHGKQAFSEPETRAIRDFVKRKGDVTAMLDVHTFGQWVIYPASCRNPVSWGKKAISKLAGQIASRITKNADAEYSAIGGTDFSYPACGDAADWFAETQHAYALTLELRPGPGVDRTGFIQPPSAIAPTSQDLITAVEDLRAFVSGEPFSTGPVLAAQGGGLRAEDPVSMCTLGATTRRDPAFSMGALCCLAGLGRKRVPRSHHKAAFGPLLQLNDKACEKNKKSQRERRLENVRFSEE